MKISTVVKTQFLCRPEVRDILVFSSGNTASGSSLDVSGLLLHENVSLIVCKHSAMSLVQSKKNVYSSSSNGSITSSGIVY